MRRRDFLLGSAAGALAACALDRDPPSLDAGPHADDDATPAPPVDASTQPDAAACTRTITLYDTNAVALYFDGSIGPLTGVIRVAEIAAGVALPRDFWHGHGGQLHHFTVTAADLAALRRGQRVMIATTVVDDHQHQLFIDPLDPTWRVPGAPPVTIAAC